MLENPVATKGEIMRRFEGEREYDDKSHGDMGRESRRFAISEEAPQKLHEAESLELLDELRKGAVARSGFRENENMEQPYGIQRRELMWEPDRSRPTTPDLPQEQKGENRSSSSLGWRLIPVRPMSALGIREVKRLKGKMSSLTRKALTNLWHRKRKAVTKE
jgi:hypothetical protein